MFPRRSLPHRFRARTPFRFLPFAKQKRNLSVTLRRSANTPLAGLPDLSFRSQSFNTLAWLERRRESCNYPSRWMSSQRETRIVFFVTLENCVHGCIHERIEKLEPIIPTFRSSFCKPNDSARNLIKIRSPLRLLLFLLISSPPTRSVESRSPAPPRSGIEFEL